MPRPTTDGSSNNKDMKCPKCGKVSLKRKEGGISCGFCGYVLTPGEEVKFRLYEMLRRSP